MKGAFTAAKWCEYSMFTQLFPLHTICNYSAEVPLKGKNMKSVSRLMYCNSLLFLSLFSKEKAKSRAAFQVVP